MLSRWPSVRKVCVAFALAWAPLFLGLFLGLFGHLALRDADRWEVHQAEPVPCPAATACPKVAPPLPEGCHDSSTLIRKNWFSEKQVNCHAGQEVSIIQDDTNLIVTCRCPVGLVDAGS
jgi:hypothetical protein